jgi:CBS domain-containing protein
MLVHELMTSPATCLRAGTPLDAAVRVLAAGHFSAVPIVDHDNNVVGIVSEADILRQHVAPDPKPDPRPVTTSGESTRPLVDDVMTRDPAIARENGDVHGVAEIFAQTGWKSLPVVRGRRLVGVISRSDVVRALATPDAEMQRRIADDFAQIGREAWQVEVFNGVATVSGAAPGREARLAKAIAETAPGVRLVVVKEPPEEPTRDSPPQADEPLALRNLRRWPRGNG